MSQLTCFVIMPIGDQYIEGEIISASSLYARYNDLIKEAILKADPTLNVTRSDEVAQPGTITTDILTRLMHSDFVVADITYPNPNVFYELGLRHACRTGTITIRDRESRAIPFDLAHLRHIDYDNTPSGLKALAEKLKVRFDHYRRNPEQPDNQLLELAKLIEFRFPVYAPPEVDPETAQLAMFQALLNTPEVIQIVLRQSAGEEISQEELLKAIMSDSQLTSIVLKTLLQTGQLSFEPKKQTRRSPTQRPRRGSRK